MLMMATISLPSDEGREDPVYYPPTNPPSDPEDAAAFIFVHGLSDSGSALQNVPDQFRSLQKLPHLHWILPSAKHNHTQMDTAWYIQHSLSPIAHSRPELAPDEDEGGMLETIAYLEKLIDSCVEAGIPTNRIVLGGFSQGMAMSLLLHFISNKYSERLGGVVALLGYLPLSDSKTRLKELREERGFGEKVEAQVPIFMARGLSDTLVPKRVWEMSVRGVKDLGAQEQVLEIHEYEGLTHTLHGPLLTDLCAWLERVVPAKE